MKFVTYNIRYSLGKDLKKDLSRVVDAVKGADVIALQEVRRNWPSDYEDQPLEISKMLPSYYWVYGPTFDMDASYANPVDVVNHRRQFGNMLLSKTPIIASRSHVLPKISSVSHFNMTSGALEGVIKTSTGYARFYSLHLSHLTSRERIMQVNCLLDIHHRATLEGGAWTGPATCGEEDWSAGGSPPPMPIEAVVMGDFNAEKNSTEYELMTGEKDSQQGNVYYVDSFIDSWEAAGNSAKELITWVKDPMASGSGSARFDYCFITPDMADRVRDAWVDTEAQGSDHQPYWVQMGL